MTALLAVMALTVRTLMTGGVVVEVELDEGAAGLAVVGVVAAELLLLEPVVLPVEADWAGAVATM
jgi:hypothetical protein